MTTKNQPIAISVQHYFSLNLKLLSLIGLKCGLKEETVHLTFKHKIPTILSNIYGIVYLIFQLYLIVSVYTSDMSIAMQTFSQMLTNIQSISKGFLSMTTINEIQIVLNEVQNLWLKYPPTGDLGIKIANAAHRTFTLSKFYFSILITCLVSYAIPVAAHISIQYISREANNCTYDFSRRLLLVKYPFEITRVSTYLLLIFKEAFLLYISSIFWVSSDTLFAQITTHICLQIQVFKSEMEDAFNHDCRQDNKILIDFIKRHRDILNICILIEDIFSPIIFSTMLFSSMSMCVNVIGTREAVAQGLYLQTGIYVALLFITLLQILFYCTFAEKISEETGTMADSVYNLNWTTKDYKLQRLMQLIIMRAQKPFVCTAYGFFPIGHQKLTSIINTSFSFYMMLQTTSNKKIE